MKATVKLLKLIGSPFGQASLEAVSQGELIQLYECAEKNRMLFFFLEKTKEIACGYFSDAYEKENSRRLIIDDSISRTSEIMSDSRVQHSVFKTIRPYASTTVDIDVIVFEEYARAVRTMQEAGYRLVVRGPMSTTLWDPEANIGIDLYEQVAVSYVTYMDKKSLADYATIKRLDSKEVSVLRPEADLACIIAHSMIKEQMYTLSEYYSYIYYLKDMNIGSFLSIVRNNHITKAVRTHTALTALLHATAHKTIPERLGRIIVELGEDNFETSRIIRRALETPHKYHPTTITKSLLEIMKGEETQKSIALQLIHMLNPHMSTDFVMKFTEHVLRETY